MTANTSTTVTDYSLNHEFLGSLQGSDDGQHQLSEEQVMILLVVIHS